MGFSGIVDRYQRDPQYASRLDEEGVDADKMAAWEAEAQRVGEQAPVSRDERERRGWHRPTQLQDNRGGSDMVRNTAEEDQSTRDQGSEGRQDWPYRSSWGNWGSWWGSWSSSRGWDSRGNDWWSSDYGRGWHR